MPSVRYTGGGHYRVAGRGFDPGDEQSVESDLADYLADVDEFEVVDTGGVDAPFDPSDYTVDELVAELDTGDYGGSELHAVAAAEEDGKNRDTALDAIEAHIPGNEVA